MISRTVIVSVCLSDITPSFLSCPKYTNPTLREDSRVKKKKMTFLRVRWWYLYLICSCYAIKSTAQVERNYQIPSFPEIVDKAMLIYDHRSPIQAATSQIHPTSAQLLFSFMNFTCSGSITRLMFVASAFGLGDSSDRQLPVFSLWHRYGDKFKQKRTTIRVLTFDQPARVQLVEINLTPPVWFTADDILGLRGIRVLRQRGGYGLTLSCIPSANIGGSSECPVSEIEELQQIPYIAIETSTFPPDQQCAMGFLNEQSLRMIADAPSNAYSSSPFSFPGIPLMAMSTPFIRSGRLIKMVIAARLNISMPVGWPELQIIRGVDNDVVFSTTVAKPKPTGYLNVYEYDLPAREFNIQYGDALNIFWSGDVQELDQLRLSLAYYNNGTPPSIPMVSVVVGDCAPDTDLLTLCTLYCEEDSICTDQPTSSTTSSETEKSFNTTKIEDTIPPTKFNGTTSNKASTVTENSNVNDSGAKLLTTTDVATICGVVFISLLLTILIILVVICMVVVRRRRKSIAVNAVDSTGMNRYVNEAQPFHDTAGNMRHLALENDYLTDEGIHGGAQASAILHDNQQDDYYYYKLYEWGVFVPAADQRGEIASTANNDNDVYSTLGESQYSKLQQFNKAPEFFEKNDNYWEPATDATGLYEQLSNKKYREILRQQIQLSDSLGSGQFGNVMKGVWFLSGGSREVAVKMLKEGAPESEKVRFLQEAAINGQFWHPNVVKLMGVVTIGEPAMIVLEYLSNGDLRGYLTKMQPIPGEMVPSNTPHTLLRFCKEIAAGMKYLSGKKFVHRDLASRNILVSEEKTCKISDFGMSRDLDNDSYYVSRGGMIPVKWTAPEALNYKKYSASSDVWSFGCVVYEIWSLGHKPFEGYTNREVIRKVDGGFRLPPPPGCPRDIYHIMIQCWHPEKIQRPSFADLLATLSDLHTLPQPQLSESGNESQLHPQANTIGAPLDAGIELFDDLQNAYLHT